MIIRCCADDQKSYGGCGHSVDAAGWQIVWDELMARIAGRFTRVESDSGRCYWPARPTGRKSPVRVTWSRWGTRWNGTCPTPTTQPPTTTTAATPRVPRRVGRVCRAERVQQLGVCARAAVAGAYAYTRHVGGGEFIDAATLARRAEVTRRR
jgi:hypothetical protein